MACIEHGRQASYSWPSEDEECVNILQGWLVLSLNRRGQMRWWGCFEGISVELIVLCSSMVESFVII